MKRLFLILTVLFMLGACSADIADDTTVNEVWSELVIGKSVYTRYDDDTTYTEIGFFLRLQPKFEALPGYVSLEHIKSTENSAIYYSSNENRRMYFTDVSPSGGRYTVSHYDANGKEIIDEDDRAFIFDAEQSTTSVQFITYPK